MSFTGTLEMKRGENLLVETWSATLEWAESLVLEARILGGASDTVVGGRTHLLEERRAQPLHQIWGR